MKEIGIYVAEMRRKKGLTQNDLANTISCSRDFISKVETCKCRLPDYYLLPLSITLEFDFVELSKNLKKFETLEHYILAYKLVGAIEDSNIPLIQKELSNEVVQREFTYGYPKIIKAYCTGIILSNIHQDFEKSNHLCMETLSIDSYDDIVNYSIPLYQENRYYSVIALLSKNLHSLRMYDQEMIILTKAVEFFEENYFNSNFPLSSIKFFYKKAYIVFLNNLSNLYISIDRYDECIKTVNKALDFINKVKYLNCANTLLSLKMKSLCELSQFDQAKETYLELKYICKFCNLDDYLYTIEDWLKDNYPQLLE